MDSYTKNPIDIKLDEKSQRLLKKLQKHAGAVSIKNSMRVIGISYRKEVKAIFERKQIRDPKLKWPDLTMKTDQAKTRKGYPPDILVATGRLKRSMTKTSAAENIDRYGHDYGFFGSEVPYGNYHDNLDEPRHKLPLRNFSQPAKSTYGSWLNTIDRDLKGQLKRIGVTAK